jgi:hypothetical protein
LRGFSFAAAEPAAEAARTIRVSRRPYFFFAAFFAGFLAAGFLATFLAGFLAGM